nr:PREDICTED: carboxy-terminal kinesin 2-like [Apteryx mantelli mantelli]
MRAALSGAKEKARALAADNQQLRKRLQASEQQLREREQRAGDLEQRVGALDSELLAQREEASRRLRELTELSDLKRELEQQLEQRSRSLDELEAAKRELSALLQSGEEKLRQTEAALERREHEAAELRQRAEAQQRSLRQQDERLHALEMERRRLHNLVQELKGNIRVFCRVRPLLESEKETQKGLEHLRFSPHDNKALTLCRAEESHTGRERKGDVRYDFSFDRVFPPACSQEEVFEEIALLVQSALDGYHVCIFAYGQTGSGKTYTMEGPDGLEPETRGMIPRAVRQLFRGAEELAAKGWQYRFTASFLEIYNESLRDLLAARPERGGDLEIRRVSSASEELRVPNLRCVDVASEEEVLELLRAAKANRSVAKTALNDRSSRSHSVFQLRLEGTNAGRELRCSCERREGTRRGHTGVTASCHPLVFPVNECVVGTAHAHRK